jgi:FkbM family methyltransferase
MSDDICLIGSLNFVVRPGSTDRDIIDEVITRDAYHVKDYIRPGMVVIDVGAHIGSFTVFAGQLGARVLSFEPMQESFDMLQRNIRENNVDAAARHIGIWNEPGMQTLHIRQRNFGGTGFFTNGPLTEKIGVITLDNVFKNEGVDRCDFLKLDCEDSELLILQAFHYLDRVVRLAVEYVSARRRDDILSLLSDRFACSVVGNDVMGIIHAERNAL